VVAVPLACIALYKEPAETPRMPAGFKTEFDKDGSRH
jgi:hypothetical protein